MEQEQRAGQLELTPSKPEKTKPSLKDELLDWLKALAIAGVLVVVIRVFFFSPFMVEGPSMQPNFHTGERIIVNKIVYSIREPQRGEIIVFDSGDGSDYIKRVVGKPGDTVKVQGDQVIVNGTRISESYLEATIREYTGRGETYNNKNTPGELTVPDGHLFVLGDNRRNSRDSRDIGFVPLDKVIGRADVRMWPFNVFGLIPHGG